MVDIASKINPKLAPILDRALSGQSLDLDEGYALIESDASQLTTLMWAASELRNNTQQTRKITYSRKIFLPLTNLCRDRCGYCTFVKGPEQSGAHTMSPDEVLKVARQGQSLGCKEALLSLGDHPEYRHPEILDTLREFGFNSTIDYVAAMSRLILEETGLLPHTNCGLLDKDEISVIAPWNVSMGIMLESTSMALHNVGGAHYKTVTKAPVDRLNTLSNAGELGVAMTTGILIGIGETHKDRVDSLMKIRKINEEYGNIQEIIIQNFRAKNDTRMSAIPDANVLDLLKTQAVARLFMGASMNIESPPNLNEESCQTYLLAGINDWGGISPLTKDFINPERAWPEVSKLRRLTSDAGFELRERTALFPDYVSSGKWFISSSVRQKVLDITSPDGYIKTDLERW